jgi:sigma-E factor negative regulatory protein RseA
MSEERPSSDRNGERDSQLSAMFDGELAAGECELLARRLVRDEVLRTQWSRYSMIAAAVRAERGVALHDRIATRVAAVVQQEVTYGSNDAAATSRNIAVPSEVLRRAASRRWARLVKPMFGAGIAASVAAASILLLRGGQGGETGVMSASNQPQTIINAPAPAPVVLASNQTASPAPTVRASNGEPQMYTTPSATSGSSMVPARLANYVVAHSEYSGPLSRRMALLGLVADGSSDVPAPAPDTDDPNLAAGTPDAP